MDLRDTLSAALPGRRDDEPAGLRQDIVDELADHLACSYGRELARGADPGAARRRSMERFGNPAAVARRLWLDAMKGRIMVLRLMLAACLILMTACLGIVALVANQTSRSAAEAAEANRRLAELFKESQATNKEILKQLVAMSKSSTPAKSQDWVPVTLRLTVERPDGPPAVGYEVALERSNESLLQRGLRRTSDATGVVDLGILQPGNWAYTIDAGVWEACGELSIAPGTPVTRSIVCPRSPPGQSSVRVRVDWPAALADKNLKAIAVFRQQPIVYQAPLTWKPQSASVVRILCLTPSGQLPLDQELGLHAWNADPGFRSDPASPAAHRPPADPHSSGDELLASGRIHGHLHLNPTISATEPIQIDEGRYELRELVLIRPMETSRTKGGQVQRVLALMNRDPTGSPIVISGEAPDDEMGCWIGPEVHGVKIGPAWRAKLDDFVAKPGQATEWVIPLSDDMIREAQKPPDAAPREKQAGDVPTS